MKFGFALALSEFGVWYCLVVSIRWEGNRNAAIIKSVAQPCPHLPVSERRPLVTRQHAELARHWLCALPSKLRAPAWRCACYWL